MIFSLFLTNKILLFHDIMKNICVKVYETGRQLKKTKAN